MIVWVQVMQRIDTHSANGCIDSSDIKEIYTQRGWWTGMGTQCHALYECKCNLYHAWQRDNFMQFDFCIAFD